jgi:hypothetical protein
MFMCEPMTAQRSVLPMGMPQALLVGEAHSHSQMGEDSSALYGGEKRGGLRKREDAKRRRRGSQQGRHARLPRDSKRSL